MTPPKLSIIRRNAELARKIEPTEKPIEPESAELEPADLEPMPAELELDKIEPATDGSKPTAKRRKAPYHPKRHRHPNGQPTKWCGCSCDGCIAENWHCLTPPCKRLRNLRPRAVVQKEQRKFGSYRPKQCGCDCPGCTDPDSRSRHCLKSPCTRKRNHRSKNEIVARYPNGRPKADPVLRAQYDKRHAERARELRKIRSQKPIEQASKSKRPRRGDGSATNVASKQDPPKIQSEWFVHAVRNDTEVKLPMPLGRDEAYTAAGTLFQFGWTVRVIEP